MDQAFQLVYQTSVTLADVFDMDRGWRIGLLERLIAQRKFEVSKIKEHKEEKAKARRKRR